MYHCFDTNCRMLENFRGVLLRTSSTTSVRLGVDLEPRTANFSSNEHRAAIQLASVVEQHVVDTQAVDDEEESPSKRVKLTK
jgi:hypothetical protein